MSEKLKTDRVVGAPQGSLTMSVTQSDDLVLDYAHGNSSGDPSLAPEAQPIPHTMTVIWAVTAVIFALCLSCVFCDSIRTTARSYVFDYEEEEEEREQQSRREEFVQKVLCSREYNPATDAQDLEEEPQCSICLGDYAPGDLIAASTTSSCSHQFHRDCIAKWLLRKFHCPVCREIYLKEDIENPETATKSSQPVAASGEPIIGDIVQASTQETDTSEDDIETGTSEDDIETGSTSDDSAPVDQL
jgi:hypothetical protein